MGHVKVDLNFNINMATDEGTIKKEINAKEAQKGSFKQTPVGKGADTQESKREPNKGHSKNQRDTGDNTGFRPRRNRRVVRRQDRKEYDQKIISIRRVTRVVAGGRRFSFSVVIVIGDRKGKVGVGVGKAGDTALAIEKSIRQAKKNMVKLNLTEDMSISHDVSSKYCASSVIILPSKGRGLVAGSSVRNVLELAGIKDVTAKIHSRSKNRLNNAQAAIRALNQLNT